MWNPFASASWPLLIGVAVSTLVALVVLWLIWKPVSHSAPCRPRVRILFGTQSGTAERFSRQLASDISGRYRDDHEVTVDSLEDIQPESLRAETLIILITATYGDGEPTDDAADFCQWLTSKCASNAGADELLKASTSDILLSWNECGPIVRCDTQRSCNVCITVGTALWRFRLGE